MPESVESTPPRTPFGALPAALRWDLFCRVIDNHGDLGVCLRLARDLATRGQRVRLWCDDLSALAWMQPTLVPGLETLPWQQSDHASPADIVIETFGCELPPSYLAAMAAAAAQTHAAAPTASHDRGATGAAERAAAPVWINLEYLSAEDYVERSHGLLSPQFSGPGKGLDKWFFYPGFTTRTGGLLREPGLIERAQAHAPRGWLAERGWAPEPGEQVLSLFAYPHAAWDDLLAALPGRWLLLLCPGAAQQAVPDRLRPGQRAIALPYLTQTDYDRLLWSCDLNLVRGEDSFVRAQWAGQPMLWQIYFQDDGAHGPKLDAFLRLAWDGAPPAMGTAWSALNRAWNGLAPWDDKARAALDDLAQAREQARSWRAKLMEQNDLATQLMAFALGKAGVSG